MTNEQKYSWKKLQGIREVKVSALEDFITGFVLGMAFTMLMTLLYLLH